MNGGDFSPSKLNFLGCSAFFTTVHSHFFPLSFLFLASTFLDSIPFIRVIFHPSIECLAPGLLALKLDTFLVPARDPRGVAMMYLVLAIAVRASTFYLANLVSHQPNTSST